MVQGAKRVLSYHGNSVSKALMDLFPNIGLDRSKFNFPISMLSNSHKIFITYKNIEYWNKPSNRRKFFEDYAKVNQFDPFDVDKWYTSARFVENEKVLIYVFVLN